MTSTIIEFDEFSPVLWDVPVGLFDGRFEFNPHDESIEWIEIDGWPEATGSRDRPTIRTTVFDAGNQFDILNWLKLELRRQFKSEIAARAARILDDGSDPHADWSPSKAQMGLSA